VSYNAAYAKIPVTQRIDFLPERYWAKGLTRNQVIEDDLNRSVPNPFHIRNLEPLRTSDPTAYRYLSTVGFFTGTSIRKHQLLRAFPNMNGLYGLRPGTSFKESRGGNRYHDLQVQFEKRFAAGLHSALMYTRAYSDRQDYYWNEFDERPAWRTNNDVRPHRLVWTGIYELPFGKGRRFVTSGPMAHLIGGWQVSWVYQYQTGPATSWPNVFYYGDMAKIRQVFKHKEVHQKDIHVWFDPNIAYRGAGSIPEGFVGFEGRTALQPGTFHVRVFPTLLDELRADGLRMWDARLLRRFAIAERLRVSFAMDLLNLTNHTNFGPPNTNPTHRDFGRVTNQSGLSRLIQFILRLEF
ncbi:MAG: hypothetical protein NZ765_10430, partial [Anaerolineae bacterium]|nr:hypothetical protein [Anaerolineae bacterium]